MKQRKNNLDEMQEQKLLKIEHNGCWLAFWGLLIVMMGQLILFPGEVRYAAGEWVLFMILSLYMGVACTRAGIWDRHLKATAKTNAVASLIAGLAVGVFCFLLCYLRIHELLSSLIFGIIPAVISFVLCFIALTLTAKAVKKRQAELDAEPEEDKVD